MNVHCLVRDENRSDVMTRRQVESMLIAMDSGTSYCRAWILYRTNIDVIISIEISFDDTGCIPKLVTLKFSADCVLKYMRTSCHK